MKVHGQPEDVLKGSTSEPSIQILRDRNPEHRSCCPNRTLTALEASIEQVQGNIFVRHTTVAKFRNKHTHLVRDKQVDDALSN
jgi:hypothetical protein